MQRPIPFLRCGLLPALCLVVATDVLAAGMQVEPGNWEIKAFIKGPMGEQTHTTTECITESELTPDVLTREASNCTFDGIEMTSTSLSWRMACDAGEGVKTTGSGRYTGAGNTMSGTVTVETKVGAETMKMESRFEGKRIGDCTGDAE